MNLADWYWVRDVLPSSGCFHFAETDPEPEQNVFESAGENQQGGTGV